MARAFNSSTREAEAGGSQRLWGQPSLQSEFQNSQDYTERPCLKHPREKRGGYRESKVIQEIGSELKDIKAHSWSYSEQKAKSSPWVVWLSPSFILGDLFLFHRSFPSHLYVCYICMFVCLQICEAHVRMHIRVYMCARGGQNEYFNAVWKLFPGQCTVLVWVS